MDFFSRTTYRSDKLLSEKEMSIYFFVFEIINFTTFYVKSKNIRNHKQKFSRFLSEIVDYIKRINYKLFIRNRKFLLRIFFCGTSFYLMLESRRFWSSSYAVIFSELLKYGFYKKSLRKDAPLTS